jgi:adenylate cyclase
MLKAYCADISDPIIDCAGEIYQYVGDEIVVSWTIGEGLRNNNCIRCFFAMRSALARKSGEYQRTYGLVPTFKAGLHCGNVTTGEIGVIKKDIIFTGDVLNTTARIQALCNAQGVDNLVSAQLTKRLALDPSLQIRALGHNALRGKDEMVALFTLDQP